MTDARADIHVSSNYHLYGAVNADSKTHVRETSGGSPVDYGWVTITAPEAGVSLTFFAQSAESAQAIGNAFLDLAAKLVMADQPHECGTPAAGELDTSDYPVPMTVSQRDPDDPESWIYRCASGHPSDYADLTTGDMGAVYGWQSADYASEDDALTGAAEHARAMHDGGLPNELAERVAAAKARAAAAHGDLIGRNVRRADDDAPVPSIGTITGIAADCEFVMVTWLPTDADLPAAVRKEAMDELAPTDGYWAAGR